MMLKLLMESAFSAAKKLINPLNSGFLIICQIFLLYQQNKLSTN
jgi:hypothetical protein